MRPITVLALLLLAFGASCSGSGIPAVEGPVDGDRAMTHVEKLVSFSPRPAGSEGARRSAEYIANQIRDMGVTVEVQEWVNENENLSLRNVIATLPGADPENGPIVAFGSHYDTKKTEGHPEATHNFDFRGAIDGGGSNGILIELIRAAKSRQNQVNLIFLFFDGEESLPFTWDESRSLLGSEHYVSTLDSAVRRRFKAFVLIDLIGSRDLKIDRDGRSDVQLQDLFQETAVELGVDSILYKTRSSTNDDHVPFLNRGIPAMVMIDFQYRIPTERGGRPDPQNRGYLRWWHTDRDTLDKMSSDALAYVGNLLWRTLPRLEAAASGNE